MKIPGIIAKNKTLFLAITGVLLFYTLAGFFILPAVLTNQIPKLVKEKLNRDIHLAEIHFNPFSMELSAHKIEMKNLDSSTFLSFKRLYLNVSVLKSITSFTLVMDQVLLENPYISVKRGKQGDFNFSDLIMNDEPEEKEESTDNDIFPVTISQISISDGKISWDDNYYSQSQHEEIHPLNLDISHFTTVVGEHSQLGFSLQFASGGQFDWQGKFELTPLKSTGNLKLDKVGFNRIWELFLQDSVNFKILLGNELIEADYQLIDTDKGIQFLVNKAHIDIYDFKLSEKNAANNDPLISVPDFKISGISLDLLNKKININNISAKDASFKAWLNSDGSINYQSLFATNTETKKSHPQNQNLDKDESDPWQFRLNQLTLNNFSLQFDDNTLGEKPAHLKLSSLNLETTDLTNKLDEKIPFKLDLKINDTGVLKVNGQAIPQPFSTELQINAEKISIKNFQPYINKSIRLDIISGLFNANTSVSLIQKENEELAISLKGDSHIDNFVTRDQLSNKDFLNWKRLSLNNIDINVAENSYLIDTIKIEQPYTRVLIRKDKSININDVVVNAPQEKKTTTKQKQASKTNQAKTNFKVSHIEMVGGKTDFSDLSLILPFSVHINHLKGTVKGVSSNKKAVAKINLNGLVGKLAPVKIKGEISPSSGDSEFKLDFKNMSLPLVTPYMADFAGRKIEKGKMSLGLNYKIKKQQLTASNNLLIDQLVLGDKVENPEATSLPLDLAIALLQDVDGKISLDVPISGSLDDPEFSVASIVIKALINVITKIVTSPFYAISSLIDSDEDASIVIFSPGKALLDDKQKTKLNGLAQALSNRPALTLEIKGTAFSEFDWPKMQEQALKQQLLKIQATELNKDSDKKVLAEHLTLSEEEYQDLLADLFIQKFPQLAERSLLGTPQLIEPEKGDFQKVAKEKLAATLSPDPKLLHNLASSRSQTIAKHLVDLNIPLERIFLLDTSIDPKDESGEIATSLNLTVK